MKLLRFGPPGQEKPGIEIEGVRYNIAAITGDYDQRFFEGDGLQRIAGYLDAIPANCPRIDAGERLGCPVASPSKIVCIGLNYASHARETGAEPPKEPVIFLKATTAIAGPNDDIILPRGSEKTDWEVELAVVIGRRASYVEEADAMNYVAGYCLHNDLSEREYQLERGGTWDKGKGCDSFAPLGPWLVTRDEIPDPHNLGLWLDVNGRSMQRGHTSDFIFGVPQVIAYVSRFMTLLPGDIISTGTPHGVGLGMNPPLYLKPGDIVELGIDGLGSARQTVKAYGSH